MWMEKLKKISLALVLVFIVGCAKEKNDSIDIDKLVKQNIEYLKLDSENIKEQDKNSTSFTLLVDEKCEVKYEISDNKISKVTSKPIGKVNDTLEYSCVVRSPIKNFINSEEDYKEYLNLLRDKTNFVFNDVTIERDDFQIELSLNAIK